MLTGSSADQQHKDASAARYSARCRLHAIVFIQLILMPRMPKLQIPRKLFTIRVSRPLTSLPVFVPPKFIPTTNLVQFPLVQVIVPLFRQSQTILPFPSTIPMLLPIIMTILWSPMVSDVNWTYMNELSVSLVLTFSIVLLQAP